MSYTASRGSKRVGAVLALVLVLSIGFGALPAFASAASTAFVSAHNVLAGQAGKVFTIRVNNTEPAGLPGGINAGKTINEVRIRGPVDLIDAVLAGSAGPAGFTDIALIGSPPAEIRFRSPSGGLAPGANGTFTVVADVRSTPTQDLNDVWRVRTSSNNGQAFLAGTSTGEGLTTNVRVLQVQNVAIVAPTGAADDRDGDGKPEVTGTQGNICVRSRVANAASTALSVSPALSGGNLNIGPALNAAQPPCSGAALAGGSGSIASHGTRDFDFLISAADVGSVTASELLGSATAPNASTPSSSDPDDDILVAKQALSIEPRADLTYVTNTLTPRAVKPGTANQAFSIGFNKGPAGSPPVPAFSGNFQSPFCNTTLSTPTSLPGGTANNQNAQFAACNIAALTDGRYQPVVNYGYTDGNGLVQGLVDISAGTKPDLEKIRLDSLIPDIKDLLINPGTSKITPPPTTEPAVTNGTAFSASGSVTDTSPDTGADTPCGPNPEGSAGPLKCTLVSSNLIQYSLTAAQGGGPQSGAKIPVPCSLSSSGSISCNITTTGFVAGTQATSLEITVEDETLNRVTELSPLVDVDIIAPFIVSAGTARGGTVQAGGQTLPGQRRTVVVQFNEAVESSAPSPQDWTVQDGQTVPVCSISQSADKRTVTLTTCQEMKADTEGTVTYAPRPVVGVPYHDRVGKDTATPKEMPLIDGIAPLAPTFDTVEGKGLQDDSPSSSKFFFNTTTPSVHMIQTSPASADDPAIADGYTVEVYEETDGTDGLNRLTDDQICGDVAAGADITLACDFSGIDRSKKVYALSIDGHSNIGLGVATDFVLDRVRPVISGVTVSSNPANITVDFSERVPRGDDFAGNWTYIASRPGGQRTSPEVETVGAGAATSQRVLGYSDQPDNPATLTPNELRYDFNVGSAYEDRAGNLLLDIHFLI